MRNGRSSLKRQVNRGGSIWFRRHPNVLATPHIAGGTDFCHRRCFTDACKDAVAVLNGEAPRFQATVLDYLIYEGKMESVV